MAQRFAKGCRTCGALTRDVSGFCEKHLANKTETANEWSKIRRENDPVWELYGWRWTCFRAALRAQGWIQCQRIIDRVQCAQMSDIYHHIWSPRVRPDLTYVPENVCGLCREHHPASEGTPEWVAGKDYVQTVMSLPSDFGKEKVNVTE